MLQHLHKQQPEHNPSRTREPEEVFISFECRIVVVGDYSCAVTFILSRVLLADGFLQRLDNLNHLFPLRAGSSTHIPQTPNPISFTLLLHFHEVFGNCKKMSMIPFLSQMEPFPTPSLVASDHNLSFIGSKSGVLHSVGWLLSKS